MGEYEISERALRLHREATVVDLHADTPSEFFLDRGYDFSVRHDRGHVDLPRLRDAAVDIQFLIAWVPAELSRAAGASFEHAMRLIDSIHRVAANTPGVRVATETAEIQVARRAGDVAAMIGVEGGHAIENSLDKLRQLYDRGARYLTLTWNNANDWADSSLDEPRHGGLTPFGREVVREMNRLGMLVDVSHAADSTFWDVLETSTAPVAATHSNARALADHPRNLTDEQLRAIAAHGGIVGINAFPVFLDTGIGNAYHRLETEATRLESRLNDEYGDAPRARLEAKAWLSREAARLPTLPLEVMAQHVEHVAEVAGIDHVALGCDFDGISLTPFGLPHIGALPRLTEQLVRRGWTDTDISKFLGGNVLRLLSEVVG